MPRSSCTEKPSLRTLCKSSYTKRKNKMPAKYLCAWLKKLPISIPPLMRSNKIQTVSPDFVLAKFLLMFCSCFSLNVFAQKSWVKLIWQRWFSKKIKQRTRKTRIRKSEGELKEIGFMGILNEIKRRLIAYVDRMNDEQLLSNWEC